MTLSTDLTVRKFLHQISMASKDPGENKLSQAALLQALSHEMTYVCGMFPHAESFEETLVGNVVSSVSAPYIYPTSVWCNGGQLRREYATTLRQYLDTGAHSTYRVWAEIDGLVTIYPGGTTIRVIGNLRPPQYTVDDLDKVMVRTVEPNAAQIPCCDERLLSLVRYRMLQFAAEQLDAFDRAQYYLQMSDRRERELRRVWEDRTTVDVGMIQGGDR